MLAAALTDDAGWLMETHAYGRGALHLGRAAPYLGVSIGPDISYLYSATMDDSATAIGFGMNLDFGLAIAATPTVALDIGGDYHPGTDVLSDASHKSVEYFAMRVGAQARF